MTPTYWYRHCYSRPVRCPWLREQWQSNVILPLVSYATTAELIRVLSYPKFRLTGDEREDLLADYLPWCETVTASEQPDLPDCRDPFDRPFLELALVGQADALVTGDGDLLALATVFTVPIITPKALRDRLQVRGNSPSSTEHPNHPR